VLRDDYLMRFVRQFAAFVARLMRLREDGSHEQALETIASGWSELLSLRHGAFDRLDDASLSLLLGSPERRGAAAWLLQNEADVRRQLGQIEAADVLERRANYLRERLPPE
jgi:hypothetical protein